MSGHERQQAETGARGQLQAFVHTLPTLIKTRGFVQWCLVSLKGYKGSVYKDLA